MRLSKRIAIGVMAAALALSMTACGGDVPEQPSNSGAGGTNTSTGSNTSTDTGDKKDDTTITPPRMIPRRMTRKMRYKERHGQKNSFLDGISLMEHGGPIR